MFKRSKCKWIVTVIFACIIVQLYVYRDHFLWIKSMKLFNGPMKPNYSLEMWEKFRQSKLPCYKRNGITPPSSFIQGDRCWNRVADLNRKGIKPIDPKTIQCLFEPLTSKNYVRKNKKTVFLGIGVHVGHASAQVFGASCGNVEYVNWEYRGKNHGSLTGLLIAGYSKAHLERTQKAFWDRYHNDPDLVRADAIVCGFDTWHCLIFAPFNKKMILNNAYRFDGHIPVGEQQQKELQGILYNAIRYNPNVVVAGEITYDLMYSQHFLGSHKIIPLPSTNEYVVQRMRTEIKKNECPGVPVNSTGYHPMGVLKISITPKRLSGGGMKVALQIKDYFLKHPLSNYKVDIMQVDMKQPYKYCDLGKYAAHIVLGYSVMSYFSGECSALAIPMFVPSPRLYGEWEKDHHLIAERKARLEHMKYDWMKENPRSLNKGYNPNDDFNIDALERWVSHSSYFFYDGATPFDSFDDLHRKIENADFRNMNLLQQKHTVLTAMRTHEHWERIDSYMHGTEDDVIPTESSSIPETLDKGYELWKKSVERPNFGAIQNGSVEKIVQGETWLLIDYIEYKKDFVHLPDCKAIISVKVLFYKESGTFESDDKSGCLFLTVESVISSLPDIFKLRNPRWRSSHHLLIMAIHATRNGAIRLVNLMRSEKGCPVTTQFKALVRNSASWKEQQFEPTHLWLVWIPTSRDITKQWSSTLYKFWMDRPSCECLKLGSVEEKFQPYEIKILEDYLSVWNTDEKQNFLHVVDQLNFELAVKGFLTKSDAILHRLWFSHLAALNVKTIPKLV